eukprot:gb/GEZN01001185.1/.p1 GENE.gb/GEZN01001185.1/~~gb/GEZN01001185.1/.p1  ORF type:complete len:567 (+),score=66.43 gb/GEZN01001185.1/:125-1825(+)
METLSAASILHNPQQSVIRPTTNKEDRRKLVSMCGPQITEKQNKHNNSKKSMVCPNQCESKNIHPTKRDEHLQYSCPNRGVSCSACGLQTTASQLDSHLAVCNQREVKCTLHCGAVMQACALQAHLNDQTLLGAHFAAMAADNLRLSSTLSSAIDRLEKENAKLKQSVAFLSYELGRMCGEGDVDHDPLKGAALVLNAVSLDPSMWDDWLPKIVFDLDIEDPVECRTAYRVGLVFQNGIGIPQKDLAKAAKWFKKAGDQGYAKAQYCLAGCYYRGEGVPLSYISAASWWKKAARQGHGWSQYELGDCYEHGAGVKKSLSQALKWYRRAAAQGDRYAQERLEELDFIRNSETTSISSLDSVVPHATKPQQKPATGEPEQEQLLEPGSPAVPPHASSAVPQHAKPAPQHSETADNKTWRVGTETKSPRPIRPQFTFTAAPHHPLHPTTTANATPTGTTTTSRKSSADEVKFQTAEWTDREPSSPFSMVSSLSSTPSSSGSCRSTSQSMDEAPTYMPESPGFSCRKAFPLTADGEVPAPSTPLTHYATPLSDIEVTTENRTAPGGAKND